MHKKPSFNINPNILNLSKTIGVELGILNGAKLKPPPIILRRNNKIKTIQASLEIEGNTLGIEQITNILEGKKFLGPAQDILEVKNAIAVYKNLSKYNALNLKHLLEAHRILMQGLIPDNGNWRQKNVGIFKGKKTMHLAPPAKIIPDLMKELFQFLKKDKQIPWLIKACIFHYELEFIHPFSDGNGRIGRLWQQLLLMKEDAIFEFIPVESMIRKNQQAYYSILEKCDKIGESTLFIEFALKQILEALKEYTGSTLSPVINSQDRLKHMRTMVKKNWFTRKKYIEVQKNISTATASRDLANGIKKRILTKQGDQNTTIYRFL